MKKSSRPQKKSTEPQKRTSQAGTVQRLTNAWPLIPQKLTSQFSIRDFATWLDSQSGFRAKSTHSIALIQTEQGPRIEIAVGHGEENMFINSIPEAYKGQIHVVTSDPLEFFNPEFVHVKGISNDQITGSGTCNVWLQEDDKTYGLVANHLTEKFLQIAAPFHVNSLSGQVKKSFPALDLAITTIKDPKSSLKKYKKFRINSAKPKIGDVVTFVGASSGTQRGVITSIQASPKIGNIRFHDLIQLKIPSRFGDSGAAILNAKHQIVGLIVGGDAANQIVYCSNLSILPASFPSKMYHLGTKPHPNSPREVTFQADQRREVELSLHTGTLVKAATAHTYGEIKCKAPGRHDGAEDVSILTHFDHSFDTTDGGTSFLNQTVYFFIVPLEYLAQQRALVGLSNNSPLVAINVTDIKKTLLPTKGLFKYTPCGTGTTVQPDDQSSTSSYSRSKTYLNYVINDYGQLILVKSKEKPIKPWEKIVASGTIRLQSPPSSKNHKPTHRLLYSKYQVDEQWKWE